MKYVDILGRPIPVPDSFLEDGSEGNRVGYFCERCNSAYPVAESTLKWHYGSFANGVCPCGKSVIGIYREKQP